MSKILVGCCALPAILAGCIENVVDYQHNIDTFSQAPNNQVDILWVVDDSASMTEEQQSLVDGFASFSSQLEASGTDFQIGVVTTSYDSDTPNLGKLLGDPPFLTNADDYQTLFSQRAIVGIDGSDKEKGFDAALGALSTVNTAPGGINEGFVRTDAHLLVIFVSDEEDCSDGFALEGQPATACYSDKDLLESTADITKEFRDLKDDNQMVSVGAIVGTNQSVCENVYEGHRYEAVVGNLGGLKGDICQSDWSGVLSDLGLTATGILTKFQLSAAAQKDTLTVEVDGTEVVEDPANGWTYDELSWWLEFHGTSVPVRGAQIAIEYDVDGGKLAPETTSATTGS